MKKKILSLVLALAMILPFAPVVEVLNVEAKAISVSEIKSQLNNLIQNTYVPGSGNGMDCYAFVSKLSNQLYGHGLQGQPSSLTLNTKYLTQIGSTLSIAKGNLDENSLQQLFVQAQVGDIIQMDYTRYEEKDGSWDSRHTMMVYEVSSAGVVFYHSGSSNIYFGCSSGTQPLWGTNKLTSYKPVSWTQMMYFLRSSDDGISLYRDTSVTKVSHTTHSYTIIGYDSAHPHKEYKYCSCGDKYYTGNTKKVSSCATCYPPSDSSSTNPDDYPYPSNSVNNANYKSGTVTANEIKWVQAILYQFGYLTSSGIDGKFGPNSIEATKEFQSDHGLTADGSAGPATLSKMKELWEAKKCSHSYDNACDATCNRCGATRTPSAHVYTNACDEYCNVCFALRSVPGHSYDNNCDTTCNRCGAVRSITHIYTNDCDEYCNVCFELRSVPGHAYDNACDTSCNICGHTRTVTHSYTNVGYDSAHPHKEYRTCSQCGYVEYTGKTGTVSTCADCYPVGVANISLSTDKATVGEKVTVSWSAVTNGKEYNVRYYNSNHEYFTIQKTSALSLEISFDKPDMYVVYVDSIGINGDYKQSNEIPLTVYKPYVVSYDLNGGEGANYTEKWESSSVTLSTKIPTRAGYTFKGWSFTAKPNIVYPAGQKITLVGGNDALYALMAQWEAVVTPISEVTLSSNRVAVGEEITFSWDAVNGTCDYSVRYKDSDGEEWICSDTKNPYKTEKITSPGMYQVRVDIIDYTDPNGNYIGNIEGEYVAEFVVYRLYTVTYDLNGGAGEIPATVSENNTIQLSNVIPQKEGFRFTGWLCEPNDAAMMTVGGTCYLVVGKSTNYKVIAQWECSGHVYDNDTDPTCNKCGYERTPPYTPGDVDGVEGVTLDDAIYLLYHVNFKDTYPVSQPVDFNGDGKEDLDDAIYLLYHVNFKDTYPLH